MNKHLLKISAMAVILTCPVLSAFGQSTEWALKMFEEQSHDFGVVARGSDVQHRLKVTNIYKETVHIADVKTSCGCTAAKPSQETLQSAETAYIEIVMDTKKFSRKKESSVIITFDAPQRAEVRIPIAAYIRTDVVTEPGSVNFSRVDRGQSSEQVLEITYAGRSNWQLQGVENLPSFMSAQYREVSRTSRGVNYQLKVVLNENAPVGPFRGQISLLTDDAANPKVPILVEGEVTPDIVVNPGMVSMGIVKPGDEKTVNVIIRGKKPFKIEKVEAGSDLNAFQVQLPKDSKPVHVLPLKLMTPNGSGTIVEEFSVSIDGREEPVKFKAVCQVVSGT